MRDAASWLRRERGVLDIQSGTSLGAVNFEKTMRVPCDGGARL